MPVQDCRKCCLALELGLVEGADPHGADTGTYDVVPGEFDDRDVEHLRFDHMDHGFQAAAVVKVALTDVTVDDDGTVLTDTREERLDLDDL